MGQQISDVAGLGRTTGALVRPIVTGEKEIGRTLRTTEHEIGKTIRSTGQEIGTSYRWTIGIIGGIIAIGILSTSETEQKEIQSEVDKIKAIKDPVNVNINITTDGQKSRADVKPIIKQQLKQQIKPGKSLNETVSDMKDVLKTNPSDSSATTDVKSDLKQAIDKNLKKKVK